jgi:rfaE bifunctional protein nucleotidyltransferase chain/domain
MLLRGSSLTTVLAHGVFDVLHPGHIEHLRQAKAMGDRLVVSVTTNKFINKGPGRPVFSEKERAGMLQALECVDQALITDHPSAVGAIAKIKPDIYVKGPDYARGEDGAGNFEDERAAVEKHGGRVEFTTGTVMSSTAIVNETMHPVSEEARDFLKNIDGAELREILANAALQTQPTVLGENIIDRYVYVEPMFKSAKESTIAHRIVDEEQWQGGASIIVQHMWQLYGHVTGFHTRGKVIKTRHVERPFNNKVFSTVASEGAEPLGGRFHDNDFRLVADFGHGLIPDHYVADAIAQTTGFLALTVQANSSNWGLNTLKKWSRADYVVADEMEWRLAVGSATEDLEAILFEEWKRLNARLCVATLGHRGCVVFDGSRSTFVPPFAGDVVDRMGAGDAFLAATTPLAYAGASPEVIGFVGNVAGAIHVGKLGNPVIGKGEFLQWVTALTKTG